jgi:hypothetical protein
MSNPTVMLDTPFEIPPDNAEAPPVLPAGRHGEHYLATLMRLEPAYIDTKDGQVSYLDILVKVQHPELGVCFAGTTAFGPNNTNLGSRTGSKATTLADSLGIRGSLPSTWGQYKERPVVVDTVIEPWKDKNGNQNQSARIVGIWWRD